METSSASGSKRRTKRARTTSKQRKMQMPGRNLQPREKKKGRKEPKTSKETEREESRRK